MSIIGPEEGTVSQLSFSKLNQRRSDYVVIAYMAVCHLLALAALPYISWQNAAVAFALYAITGCLGITLGYHRLLTHRSFQVPKLMERFFALCGMTALQGSPLEWVGHHRMHHAFSDRDGDPHDASRGFWFSHIGWIFLIEPKYDDMDQLRRYARDIASDPFYRLMQKPLFQISWQAFIGWVLYLAGGWSMVGWGVFVRLVVLYHATWLVNSAAHMWGYKNYPDVDDRATNNWWVALVSFGEGWHNNHHKFAATAKAGHRWWEIDVTYWVITVLRLMGLAKKIKPIPAIQDASSDDLTVSDEAAILV